MLGAFVVPALLYAFNEVMSRTSARPEANLEQSSCSRALLKDLFQLQSARVDLGSRRWKRIILRHNSVPGILCGKINFSPGGLLSELNGLSRRELQFACQ